MLPPSLTPPFLPCTFCFTTTFQQHSHHHLRTVAQLAPQTTTFSFTSHNEKQRASVDSLIFNMLYASTQASSWVFPVFLFSQRSFEFFSLKPFFRQHDCFNATIAAPIDCPAPVFPFSACSNQQPVLQAHDPVILRSATMDAQWQQYYWNHYLMQQHHQQLTNPDTTILLPPPPTTPTAPQAPTAHSLMRFAHTTSTTPTLM